MAVGNERCPYHWSLPDGAGQQGSTHPINKVSRTRLTTRFVSSLRHHGQVNITISHQFQTTLFSRVGRLHSFMVMAIPIQLRTSQFTSDLQTTTQDNTSTQRANRATCIISHVRRRHALLPFSLKKRTQVNSLKMRRHNIRPLMARISNSLAIHPQERRSALHVSNL